MTKISYGYILKLSFPIMVGSAVQNIIALTDQYFLGRVGEVETGAIGYASVFYLIITTIGYGFSKGGQIMIARLTGENREHEIGKVTVGMIGFLMILAVIFLLLCKTVVPLMFRQLITSDAVYTACMQFLDYRIYGIFFSYFAISFVGLYSGVGRTTMIIYNAVILGVVNILANYCLVGGNWGFAPMGMKGSGIASSVAEGFACLVFTIAILTIDRKYLIRYGFMDVFKFKKEYVGGVVGAIREEFHLVVAQFRLSLPVIIQSFVGMASWFIFFALVENMGEKELAVSSVLRAVYLVLMIPCWGLSSATNTIISKLMGERRFNDIMPAGAKVATVSFLLTAFGAMWVVLFPDFVFQIGTDDQMIIDATKPMIWVLLVALGFYSISVVYFNTVTGTGATTAGLILQLISVAIYMTYIFIGISWLQGGLEVAWLSEPVYFLFMMIFSILYLRSRRWEQKDISRSNRQDSETDLSNDYPV